jgi:hypothetical protein
MGRRIVGCLVIIFTGCSGRLEEPPKPEGLVDAPCDSDEDVDCEPDLVCLMESRDFPSLVGTCQMPCGHPACGACTHCYEGEPDFCIDVGCSR